MVFCMVHFLYMFGIFFFILGLCVGSFLNVVLFRYGTGIGFGGRSRCASSGKTLRWFELIPVLSFLVQGGKSRHTGAKLSLQYPFVELLTGVLFMAAYYFSLQAVPIENLTSFLILLITLFVVCALLVLIVVYDTKHMIIPNEFSYPLIVISLISIFVSLNPLVFFMPSIGVLLSGPIVAAPFALMWLISGGKWMGFADAKLALAIGWFLGISSGFAAVLVSFWFGALFGIVVLALSKKENRKLIKIPFGPFLVAGLILALVYNISIESIAMFFV